jgi:hypothetical protein
MMDPVGNRMTSPCRNFFAKTPVIVTGWSPHSRNGGVARGAEIELNANRTKFWATKLNVTQQAADCAPWRRVQRRPHRR